MKFENIILITIEIFLIFMCLSSQFYMGRAAKKRHLRYLKWAEKDNLFAKEFWGCLMIGNYEKAKQINDAQVKARKEWAISLGIKQ